MSGDAARERYGHTAAALAARKYACYPREPVTTFEALRMGLDWFRYSTRQRE
jgi:hypothetical protein